MFYTIKNDELYEYSENNSNLTGEVFFTDITTQENLTKNIDAFKVVGNKLVDISTEPEYIAEQEAKEKAIQKAEILKQIDELEQSQARAIREVALNKGTTFAMGKLQLLDEQITELRGQLNA